MFPSEFNFSSDGDKIFHAKLDLVCSDNSNHYKKMEYQYHITGTNVDCHYTQEEVQEFIMNKNWRMIF